MLSFIKRDDVRLRQVLYQTYLLGFILMLAFYFWYIFFSDDLESNAMRVCKDINNTKINWDGCEDAIDSFLWLFVTIWMISVILIRLYCVRILYYYAKEARGYQQDR